MWNFISEHILKPEDKRGVCEAVIASFLFSRIACQPQTLAKTLGIFLLIRSSATTERATASATRARVRARVLERRAQQQLQQQEGRPETLSDERNKKSNSVSN